MDVVLYGSSARNSADLRRSMVKKGKGGSLVEQSWKLTQRLPNLGITKNNLIGITLFIIVNVWRMVHFKDFVLDT